MATPSGHGRKRTKTFTGCWTCRWRKVKCDETGPPCLQCRAKSIACEGYGIRLQWLPPRLASASDGARGPVGPDAHPSSALRRVLPLETQRPAIQPQRLDQILSFIDTLDADHVSEDETLASVENFGVFKLDFRPSTHRCGSSRVASASALPACTQESPAASPAASLHSSESSPDFASQPDLAPLSQRSEAPASDGGSSDMTRLEQQDTPHPLDPRLAALAKPAEPRGRGPTVVELGCRDSPSVILSDEDWRYQYDFGRADRPQSPVAELDHFLMRHYSERVCHQFCTVDIVKSPWKTVHLPRTLQGLGELSITALGICPMIIGATAVGHDLYCIPRPKYKEFLATMLSMITINVMSGDLTTCGVHLDGAQQLLQHIWGAKKQMSEKTKSLQRVYCYLRIIWESTQVMKEDHEDHEELPPRPISDESVFQYLDDDGPSGHDSHYIPSNGLQDMSMSPFECIYGIPQSLLVMLEETIKLIDKVQQARRTEDSVAIPSALEPACEDLEQRILDWSSHLESPPVLSAQSADSIRLLSHRYLRQYVQNVLQSIEAVERIKAEANVLAHPLFWPAFIAASEAFSVEQQQSFQRWYTEAESYGIASVRTGIRVLHEVWKQGPRRAGSRMDFVLGAA
ncbi:hypothetical protein KC331_g107 [Hortaea werneckii]|nr:hypothetical protein KC331_g107 [Hortaea werneckii]KAI7722851.1 hypothetical protein KC353_g139 [Hortaea werneckii]